DINFNPKPIPTTNVFGTIPNHVAMFILEYLSPKELVKVSCVKKDCGAICFSDILWKRICHHALKENPWIPQVDIEKVNQRKVPWYIFYREKIFPLLMDRKQLRNAIEKAAAEKKLD